MPEKLDFLKFKDRPLVRSGKTVFYGDMSEKYVIKMEIKSTKKVDDLDVADKVSVSLIHTAQRTGSLSRAKKAVFMMRWISVQFGLKEPFLNNYKTCGRKI